MGYNLQLKNGLIKQYILAALELNHVPPMHLGSDLPRSNLCIFLKSTATDVCSEFLFLRLAS